MSQRAEAGKLARKLRKEGFQVVLSGRGHWEVLSGDSHVTTFSHSPSDMRWKKNALANIRKWKRERGIPAETARLPVPYHETHGGTHPEPPQAERYIA